MALRKPLSWGAGTVIEIAITLVGLPKQHVGCLEVAVLVGLADRSRTPIERLKTINYRAVHHVAGKFDPTLSPGRSVGLMERTSIRAPIFDYRKENSFAGAVRLVESGNS